MAITKISKWLSLSQRVVTAQLDQHLSSYGLNASNYYYLLLLREKPEIKQEELAHIMLINPSNVARAISQLLALNYVVKRQDSKDKRACRLSLSEKGEAIYTELLAIEQEQNQKILRVLDPDEREKFMEQLEKIARTLKKDNA